MTGPYVDTRTPVRCVCSSGHECRPAPNHVIEGHGICLPCKGKAWDVFYVVTHARNPWVKFGITSGDARSRLGMHRRAGYTTVVRLVKSLPGSAALEAEGAVKKALRDAGESPVLGREYFDIRCLALILDVADSWLAAVVA